MGTALGCFLIKLVEGLERFFEGGDVELFPSRLARGLGIPCGECSEGWENEAAFATSDLERVITKSGEVRSGSCGGLLLGSWFFDGKRENGACNTGREYFEEIGRMNEIPTNVPAFVDGKRERFVEVCYLWDQVFEGFDYLGLVGDKFVFCDCLGRGKS